MRKVYLFFGIAFSLSFLFPLLALVLLMPVIMAAKQTGKVDLLLSARFIDNVRFLTRLSLVVLTVWFVLAFSSVISAVSVSIVLAILISVLSLFGVYKSVVMYFSQEKNDA